MRPDPSRGTYHQWFAVPEPVSRRSPTGDSGAPPKRIVHAKRMGTETSACGLVTSTWMKLFHIEFRAHGIDACGACRERVREDSTLRRDPRG